MYGDDSLIVDYDSPVDQDKEFNLKVAGRAPHTRTVNEWRELQNLKTVPDGDVYIVPSKYTAFESPADIAEPKKEESALVAASQDVAGQEDRDS